MSLSEISSQWMSMTVHSYSNYPRNGMVTARSQIFMQISGHLFNEVQLRGEDHRITSSFKKIQAATK